MDSLRTALNSGAGIRASPQKDWSQERTGEQGDGTGTDSEDSSGESKGG